MSSSEDTYHQFLVGSSEAQLVSWFLQAFELQNFAPIRFEGTPSIEAQFQTLFFALAPDIMTQEKIKHAVIRAAIEWGPAHRDSTLSGLAFIASAIDASGIVNILRDKINLHMVPLPTVDESTALIDDLITVMGRFSPLREAREALEHIFFNEQYAPLAAMLLHALASGNPNRYPSYIEWFYVLSQNHPALYDLSRTIYVFREAVSLPTIMSHLHELTAPARSWLMECFARDEYDPIDAGLLPTEGKVRLIASERMPVAFGSLPISSNALFANALLDAVSHVADTGPAGLDPFRKIRQVHASYNGKSLE